MYSTYNQSTYQQKPQLAGKAAHESIDSKTYSKSLDVLMDYELYCEKYKLHGKLDVFDCKTGILTERKKNIKQIYDGYVFQVYAHYFGLIELGFEVKKIRIHDLTANKNYPIPLPQENPEMFAKFEQLIENINTYDLEFSEIIINPEKCKNCIYSNLCDKAELC